MRCIRDLAEDIPCAMRFGNRAIGHVAVFIRAKLFPVVTVTDIEPLQIAFSSN